MVCSLNIAFLKKVKFAQRETEMFTVIYVYLEAPITDSGLAVQGAVQT